MPTIVNSSQVRPKEGLLIFVFGGTGIGKTRLASESSDEKMLIIDSEITRGTSKIKSSNIDILHLSKWMSDIEIDDIMKEIEANDYKMIVLDSINELAGLVEDDLIQSNAVGMVFSKTLTLKGHGEKGAKIIQFCRRILQLGVDVIVTCNEELIEEGSGEEKTVRISPTIPASVKKRLLHISHLSMRLYWDKASDGKIKRCLTADPAIAHSAEAKDRFKILPQKNVADLKLIIKKIKNKYYE